ncbi:MAG TPA: hypothetical protein VFH78_00065 [Candidatus Thermoplasmatota archaeon]|nr:hypothetical protein [Candidatus Thermoplasmatota archaeon]
MSRTTFVEEAEAFLERLEDPTLPDAITRDRDFVRGEFQEMIRRALANDLPSRQERARGLWRTLDHWPAGYEWGGDLTNELVRLERMYEML